MKKHLLFALLLLIGHSTFSQNILDALQMKEDSIGAYFEGETRATDTLIDLQQGYYEEFLSFDIDSKKITRQAALFHNQDGTICLGISTSSWDFACYTYNTNFYEITKSQKSINRIGSELILPSLEIKEFIVETKLYTLLEKLLPDLQGSYLDSSATIQTLLNEIYEIEYVLGPGGTHLNATLRLCDYIPTNEIEIEEEDWSLIENATAPIRLEYDKLQKRFVTR